MYTAEAPDVFTLLLAHYVEHMLYCILSQIHQKEIESVKFPANWGMGQVPTPLHPSQKDAGQSARYIR